MNLNKLKGDFRLFGRTRQIARTGAPFGADGDIAVFSFRSGFAAMIALLHHLPDPFFLLRGRESKAAAIALAAVRMIQSPARPLSPV